jgi:cytidylate kinase
LMNATTARQGTLYVVGPPGAGKSTIGRAAASRIGLPFHALDDWAGVVYPPSARSTPMTDAQVDRAVSMLFGSVGHSAAVCEFAHHDYVGFMHDSRYPQFAASRKVIVTADLAACSARNEARRSRVAAEYVERAWRSTRDLIDLCAAEAGGDYLVIDTTSMPVPAAVETAACFFAEV